MGASRQLGIVYDGTQNYNKIPADIRNVHTLGNFKHKLKMFVIRNIQIE